MSIKNIDIAKSNCTTVCAQCGESISPGIKYGVKNGESFCPCCYNMEVMRSIANRSYTRNRRIKRIIMRIIFLGLAVAAFFVLSFFYKKYTMPDWALVLCLLGIYIIACGPFLNVVGIFAIKGFDAFVEKEFITPRKTPVYYINGINKDNCGLGFRIMLFFADAFLAIMTSLIILLAVIPHAIIDIFKIAKANKKNRKEYELLLFPYKGNKESKYNFVLEFKDCYSKICVDYYARNFHCSKDKALSILEKGLEVKIAESKTAFECYKTFERFYWGRKDHYGKRFVDAVISIDEKSLTEELAMQGKVKRSNR